MMERTKNVRKFEKDSDHIIKELMDRYGALGCMVLVFMENGPEHGCAAAVGGTAEIHQHLPGALRKIAASSEENNKVRGFKTIPDDDIECTAAYMKKMDDVKPESN